MITLFANNCLKLSILIFLLFGNTNAIREVIIARIPTVNFRSIYNEQSQELNKLISGINYDFDFFLFKIFDHTYRDNLMRDFVDKRAELEALDQKLSQMLLQIDKSISSEMQNKVKKFNILRTLNRQNAADRMKQMCLAPYLAREEQEDMNVEGWLETNFFDDKTVTKADQRALAYGLREFEVEYVFDLSAMKNSRESLECAINAEEEVLKEISQDFLQLLAMERKFEASDDILKRSYAGSRHSGKKSWMYLIFYGFGEDETEENNLKRDLFLETLFFVIIIIIITFSVIICIIKLN